MTPLTTVLVAHDTSRTLAGALLAFPPFQMLAVAANAGIPVAEALTAASSIVKIGGVAVTPSARGAGIGSSLVGCCTDLYFRLGYHLIYGHIQDNPCTTAFWTRNGFSVLAPGEPLYLGPQIGRPFEITPEPGCRFLTRWR